MKTFSEDFFSHGIRTKSASQILDLGLLLLVTLTEYVGNFLNKIKKSKLRILRFLSKEFRIDYVSKTFVFFHQDNVDLFNFFQSFLHFLFGHGFLGCFLRNYVGSGEFEVGLWFH